MTGNSSSTKDSQTTLDEAIKMPATFVEALAVLVKAVQHENQLIAAVVIGIIAIIVPVIAIVSSVEDRTMAILLLATVGVLVFLALATFMSAFMLVRFRKKGKQTFVAEYQEDLQQQLEHHQGAFHKMHSRIAVIDEGVQSLIQNHRIDEQASRDVQDKLSELLRYLQLEEKQFSTLLSRVRHTANMNMKADSDARKARWQARQRAAEEQKAQQLNSSSTRKRR